MASNYNDFRLATDGGIRYALLAGPEIEADDKGAKSSEQYLIRGVDVGAFFAEAMPPPIAFLNFVLLPPRRRMPGTGIFVTKSVKFKPFTSELPGDPFGYDPSARDGSYNDFYVADISYETGQEDDDNPHDENKPETFLEHSITAGGEFLSLPATRTQVEDVDIDGTSSPGAYEANEDNGMPILKTVCTIEHNLKWKFCLRPNWDTILSALGHVNDRAHKVFFDGRKETVLFSGVSGSQVYMWGGARLVAQPWALDFKFSHKEMTDEGGVFGWNHAYSPKKGKWVRLWRNGGVPLYLKSNLALLFRT